MLYITYHLYYKSCLKLPSYIGVTPHVVSIERLLVDLAGHSEIGGHVNDKEKEKD